ncbi:MAG: hypothetical protein PG981_000919 [Wolbachia endosymbiont of Ctenocephalides orientis wCori]|nr:MAG: hypothetical protein PG981_000919 [Wolbachia endosymbiont of Ctenocephalides orientis wCori]
MSKLQLKIKNHDNNFVSLNNIRNLRFTLRNDREDIKDIPSFGWRKVLDRAGSRNITVKINGILDNALADELLRNSAIMNSINEYEINFNVEEKLNLRCSIELYERYYEPVTFDSFTVVLTSAEVVNAFH